MCQRGLCTKMLARRMASYSVTSSKALPLFFRLVTRRNKISISKHVLLNQLRNQGFHTSQQTSSWHIVGALCLERKPIVTQTMNKLEKEYWEMLKKIEVEESLLSDHELRHIEDSERAEKIKSEEADAGEIEKATKLTAQDEEDANLDELNKFVPASRKTSDDVKSLERHLDSTLLLVVKKKLGNTSHWILPQAVRNEKESLRQTTERVCQEHCGSGMNVRLMGNAPVGYYKYKYPKAARKDDNIIGAKVFFFKAQHIKGNLSVEEKKGEEFMWLTQSELPKYLQKDYLKAVKNILISDSNFEVFENIEKVDQLPHIRGLEIRVASSNN